MPFDQTQVRDYAVVIHAGNDEWTWQVMDFDARIAPQGGAPDREAPGAAACSRPRPWVRSPGSVAGPRFRAKAQLRPKERPPSTGGERRPKVA